MQTIYAKLGKGMDTFIRVSSTLRRKEYCIAGMNLQVISSDPESHEMHIYFRGSNPRIADRAIRQLSKLIDVTELQIIEEA